MYQFISPTVQRFLVRACRAALRNCAATLGVRGTDPWRYHNGCDGPPDWVVPWVPLDPSLENICFFQGDHCSISRETPETFNYMFGYKVGRTTSAVVDEGEESDRDLGRQTNELS